METESVLILILVIGLWVVYELFGKMWAMTSYFRLFFGIAVIIYIFYQPPEKLKETVALVQGIMKESKSVHKQVQTHVQVQERNVSGLMKKRIAANQQWKCGMCKTTLDETYEVDHSLALYKGGTNDPSNLVALCPNCHRKKTVDERLNV